MSISHDPCHLTISYFYSIPSVIRLRYAWPLLVYDFAVYPLHSWSSIIPLTLWSLFSCPIYFRSTPVLYKTLLIVSIYMHSPCKTPCLFNRCLEWERVRALAIRPKYLTSMLDMSPPHPRSSQRIEVAPEPSLSFSCTRTSTLGKRRFAEANHIVTHSPRHGFAVSASNARRWQIAFVLWTSATDF